MTEPRMGELYWSLFASGRCKKGVFNDVFWKTGLKGPLFIDLYIG
jgi:hypothetical protein